VIENMMNWPPARKAYRACASESTTADSMYIATTQSVPKMKSSGGGPKLPKFAFPFPKIDIDNKARFRIRLRMGSDLLMPQYVAPKLMTMHNYQFSIHPLPKSNFLSLSSQGGCAKSS
jgi:hypothetical protein